MILWPRILARDGNFSALQQSIDSSLAFFYEVAEAVRQPIARIDEAGRQVRTSAEVVNRVSKKIGPRFDEFQGQELDKKLPEPMSTS